MNEKEKKLASKIEGLIQTDTDASLQDIYSIFVVVMHRQKDYFQKQDPHKILKVLFYIFSLKETGDFLLGDKLLNNIFFATLMSTSNKYFVEECDECGGSGEVRCDECGGDERVTCGECDGELSEPCPECDGTGNIEDDGTMVTCDECGGSGEIDCRECDGSGDVSCNNCRYGQVECGDCDGHGDNETNQYEYRLRFIVSWDKELKDLCEMYDKSSNPVCSEDDLLENPDVLILAFEQEHAKFMVEANPDQEYCIYVSDEAGDALAFTSKMNLTLWEDDMSFWI